MQKNKRRVVKVESTYQTRWEVYDHQTGRKRIIPENGKVTIKTPKEVRSDKQEAFLQKRKNRSPFNKMIDRECGNFYFCFYNKGLYGLDIKEGVKTRFLYLATYLGYGENGGYICHKNGVPMNKKDVVKLLGLSPKRGNETIADLVRTGLLFEDGDNLQVNQDVAFKGTLNKKQMNESYTRMFVDGIRSLYMNCSTTQHKQLYYLFRLLPYINLKFNAICQNPTEQVAEQVIPLTLKDICELLGAYGGNQDKFKKDMYKLKIFNQYVMKGIEGATGMWFKINPRIFYGGIESHIEQLEELLISDFSIN